MKIQSGPITLPVNTTFNPYLRVKLSAGVLALASGTEDEIGTLVDQVLTGATTAAVLPKEESCVRYMVVASSVAQFATLYAAANGKVDDTGTLVRGIALEAGSGDGAVIRVLTSVASLVGTVGRDQLTQDDLQKYAIPFTDFRVWDAQSVVPVTTAASDDLAHINGTFLSAAPKLQSSDGKATTVTQKIGFQFAVPPEYVAGETLTLRINAGMNTTVSDTTATIDAQVARMAAPTVDICATNAQSINSLTAADKDFTLTPTNVVPGDILECVLTIAVTDASTGTAVKGEINKVTVLADIKG